MGSLQIKYNILKSAIIIMGLGSLLDFFKFIDLSGQSSQFGAYANPLTGTSDFGPYPQNMTARDAFRGPDRWRLDAIVTKRFTFKERYSVQLRAEAYNLFNHANLFVQTGNADVSSFNFIEAKKFGNRNVQLAIKFIF